MQWYRAYVGMAADPKFKVVATIAGTNRATALAVWVAMLEHACCHSGSIHNLDPLDIGCALDLEADLVQRIMMTFSERGMVSGSELSAWKRRQYVSDSSVERVRRYRERHGNGAVPARNGDVTPPDTEQNRTDSRADQKERVGATEPRPRGTRFPHEAMPEAWKQFCNTERPDLDPSATYAVCRDYWIAQPGQRGVKRDWDATWRNWVRNQKASLRPVEIVRDKAYWERVVDESR